MPSRFRDHFPVMLMYMAGSIHPAIGFSHYEGPGQWKPALYIPRHEYRAATYAQGLRLLACLATSQRRTSVVISSCVYSVCIELSSVFIPSDFQLPAETSPHANRAPEWVVGWMVATVNDGSDVMGTECVQDVYEWLRARSEGNDEPFERT